MKSNSSAQSDRNPNDIIRGPLTVKEAASQKRVCKTVIYEAIHGGKLAYHKVGRRGYRIEPEDLQRWWDNQRVDPQARSEQSMPQVPLRPSGLARERFGI